MKGILFSSLFGHEVAKVVGVVGSQIEIQNVSTGRSRWISEMELARGFRELPVAEAA